MQLTTSSLTAEPCDDEYDDLANLSCLAEDGYWFALARFPDENTVDVTARDAVHSMTGVVVTLSPGRLHILLDSAAAKALDGHTDYEILHHTSAMDMPTVIATLELILADTGTLINQLA